MNRITPRALGITAFALCLGVVFSTALAADKAGSGPGSVITIEKNFEFSQARLSIAEVKLSLFQAEAKAAAILTEMRTTCGVQMLQQSPEGLVSCPPVTLVTPAAGKK